MKLKWIYSWYQLGGAGGISTYDSVKLGFKTWGNRSITKIANRIKITKMIKKILLRGSLEFLLGMLILNKFPRL